MKSTISKALVALWCSISLVFSGSLVAHANEQTSLHASTSDTTLAVENPSSPSSPSSAEEPILSTEDDAVTLAPKFAGGSVIKILTSKPACEAMKTFYNTAFPNYPKLKCKKSGKVWLLTR